jgi:hypothetical protein
VFCVTSTFGAEPGRNGGTVAGGACRLTETHLIHGRTVGSANLGVWGGLGGAGRTEQSCWARLLAALVSTLGRPIGRLSASRILHQPPSILIKQTLNVIRVGGEKQRNAIERGKSKREIRESRGENHGVMSGVLFGNPPETNTEERDSNLTSAMLGEKSAERK